MPKSEPMRHRQSILSLLSLVLCLLLSRHADAGMPAAHPSLDPHHIDGTVVGGTIDLTPQWLLAQGDDPRYSDPAFDDSHWLLVDTTRPLRFYGLHNVDAVWYRAHVKLRPGLQHLGLLVRLPSGSEQYFVNGVSIGSRGSFQPGGSVVYAHDDIYPIPDAAIASGDLTIAIRGRIGFVAQGGVQTAGIASGSAIMLGPVSELSERKSLFAFRDYTSNYTNLTLQLLILMIASALFLAMRNQKEYLALIVYITAVICQGLVLLWISAHNIAPNDGLQLVRQTLLVLHSLALLEFVRLVLNLPRTRLFVWYEISIITFDGVVGFLLVHHFIQSSHAPAEWLIVSVNIVIGLILLPVDLGLPLVALWVWFKRRNPDALLLFIPLFVQVALTYFTIGSSILYHAHLTAHDSLPETPVPFLYVAWSEIGVFFFNIALLLFVVLRTTRLARAQAASAAEIHAAQSVQQLLLARASQVTPGFDVQSVYLPAEEVGGDFFLVSPNASDDSITAIVGDVSGHGLTAAMRVSMILGVLRREESRDPATILTSLNEALLSQGEMGFTTACCVRLERAGRFLVANAGHIAPYIAGVEIATPPALPLGLASAQIYETVEGELPGHERLVLMSDGVPEARSRKGELYGFDRLPNLTRMPAHDIASVAQRFGQEDDITVLTLACLPA